MRWPWRRRPTERRWLGDGPGPVEPVPDGAGFTVGTRWKELVVYAEGDRSYELPAAWGREWTVYVPDGATWDDVVPDWLRGRRAEVVERLRRHSGHVVEDTDTGHPWAPGGRSHG